MKLALIAGTVAVILVVRLVAQTATEPSPVHSVKEISSRNRIDPATGRAITPVANGQFSSVTVWQFESGAPSHLHREHDEVIYCTEGEGITRLGNQKIKTRPGDFLLIPANTPHGVTVTSKKPMRGISVFSPSFDGKDRVPVEELK